MLSVIPKSGELSAVLLTVCDASEANPLRDPLLGAPPPCLSSSIVIFQDFRIAWVPASELLLCRPDQCFFGTDTDGRGEKRFLFLLLLAESLHSFPPEALGVKLRRFKPLPSLVTSDLRRAPEYE